MDALVLTWMNDLRHPWLTVVMSAATWLGSFVVLMPLALLMGWRSAAAGCGLRQSALAPAAVLGAALLAHTLKWLVNRARPDLFPGLIPMPSDASFPSAHAWQVTAFVAAWLTTAGGWRKPGHVAAGVALALLVAVSRLYLQVHYPGDVLFGVLAGLVWVWALHRWLQGGKDHAK